MTQAPLRRIWFKPQTMSHAEAPVDEVVPLGQAEQEAAPAVENVLAVHLLQRALPAEEEVPFVQSEHLVAPSCVENRPAGQLVQSVAPEVFEKVPAAQAVQG